MKEFSALFALELRSFYGINKFRHTKDKKEKNRFCLLAGAFAILIAVVLFYVGGLVYGLCYLGLSDIVSIYLTVIASLLVLAFGIFKAGHMIFGSKGYDILASMPIKPRSVVLSRFAAMYFEDLLLTFLIFIPGAAVYGVMQKPNAGFFLTVTVGAIFIPAIPLVISTLVGTLITAISARMKHKSLVQIILSVALIVFVLAGSFSFNEFDPEKLSELAGNIGAMLEKIYPPAAWMRGGFGGLAIFVAVSVALTAVCIIVTAKIFGGVMRGLATVSAKHDYKMGELESRGMLRALYVREFKRYFSSSVYVTNTIIGPIMGTVASAALCFVGLDRITGALPFEIDRLIPFAIAAVFCMMTTTSTSISMEGKHFWIVKTMPVPAKALLDAKILLNLSLMLPFYIISEIFLIIAVRPDTLQLLWLLLIPALAMLFSTVFGITVNLKLHSFDWEKEEQIVKQSASAALGGFAGFLLSAALGVAVFAIPFEYTEIAICALLAVGTWILYERNNKVKLEEL